jgi:Kef-type K+ transport system membrane component KefB
VAAAPAKTRPSLSGTVSSVVQAAKDVSAHVDAAERDTIVVLGVSALVPPVMNMLNLSPVLGFLFAGIVIGPSGLGLVRSSPDCPAPELTNLSQLHRPRCEPAWAIRPPTAHPSGSRVHGAMQVSDVATTTKLAELGVVFFLFEMGLELELER